MVSAASRWRFRSHPAPPSRAWGRRPHRGGRSIDFQPSSSSRPAKVRAWGCALDRQSPCASSRAKTLQAGPAEYASPMRQNIGSRSGVSVPAGRHRALRGARGAAAEARLHSRAGRAPARGGASRRHRGPGETADLPTLSDSQPSEGTDGTGRSCVLSGVPNARRGPAHGQDPARSRFADEVQVVDVEELDAEGAGCEPPPWPPRPGTVVMVFRSLLTSSITGDPDFVPNTS